MKILIYGGEGFVGQEFIKLLIQREIPYISGKIDLINLKDEVDVFLPTHIVTLVGHTIPNYDQCLYAPASLVVLCYKRNIHLTYLGSGIDNCKDDIEDDVLNLLIKKPIMYLDKSIVPCDIQRSMTYLPDILPIVVDMILKYKTGTYVMTNPGTISNNEILASQLSLLQKEYPHVRSIRDVFAGI